MKIIGMLGAFAIALLLGVIAVGPSVAEYFAFKNVDPAKREQMKKEYGVWQSNRIHLPEEALKPLAYSEATLAAAQEFAGQWEKLQKPAQKALDNGNAQPDPAVVARALPELAPLLDAFCKVVRQGDYQISAFNMPPKGMATIQYNYLGLQTTAKLLKYRAQEEAKQGRIDEALATAEIIVRSARASRYDTLITQLIAIAVGTIGTRAWNEMIQSCGDARLLRQALENQNGHVAALDVLMSRETPVYVMDCVGMLRELNGAGRLNIEYQDLTGKALLARSQEAQVAVWEKTLEQVKNDPKQYAELQRMLQGAQSYSATLGGRSYNLAGTVKKLGGRYAVPFLFTVMRPNLDEAFTRAEVLKSRFDLLRLETARKLYTLEKGKAPEKVNELVPGWLAEMPSDRFSTKATLAPVENADLPEKSGKTAAYKEANNAFYSIGPDRKDNLNAITYDPSNGTFSAGDLALGR